MNAAFLKNATKNALLAQNRARKNTKPKIRCLKVSENESENSLDDELR